MKTSNYKGHAVELDSHKLKSGRWAARATVIVRDPSRVKKIPIFGRRQGLQHGKRGSRIGVSSGRK